MVVTGQSELTLFKLTDMSGAGVLRTQEVLTLSERVCAISPAVT